MRTISAVLTIAIAALPAAAQDPPKKYDLKFTEKLSPGQRLACSETGSMNMTATFFTDGKPVKKENSTGFSCEYLMEVLKCRGHRAAEAKWTLSKATRRDKGTESPCGFAGKTLLVTWDEDGKKTIRYEQGAELTAEDLETAKELHASGIKTPRGQPSGYEVFGPKEPVAVGDSWTPDIKALAAVTGKANFQFDMKSSTATAKLKSVDQRGGSEFGNVVVDLELYLTNLNGLKLDEPLMMKLGFELDACIDGRVTQGAMKMKIVMKGSSSATIPGSGEKAEFEFDTTGDRSIDIRPAKP